MTLGGSAGDHRMATFPHVARWRAFAGEAACSRPSGDAMKVDSGMGPLSTTPAGPDAVATRRARIPAPPATAVERRRLLDTVSRAVDDALLTLVCASAGSGKTVLVSRWAEHGQRFPV